MAEEKQTGFTTREALFYHETIRPGKLEIVATKPMTSQRDLSLAYSPGVAYACNAIVEDPQMASAVTARGNLVVDLGGAGSRRHAQFFGQ